MSKSLEILKKYSNVMNMEDYALLKRDLKILESYRAWTTYEIASDICLLGTFNIHDDCSDFEYFYEKEYLKRKTQNE